MYKRTSFIVDTDLLNLASQALGTEGPTATVRGALERAVRQESLKELASWELPEDFPEQVAALRQPRQFTR